MGVISLVVAAVWILPGALAIATKPKRKWEIVAGNIALGWFPLVWLFLIGVVWSEWEWWGRSRPQVERYDCGCIKKRV